MNTKATQPSHKEDPQDLDNMFGRIDEIPAFKREPMPATQEPVNYLKHLGELLKLHRLKQPRENRSAQTFANTLSKKYVGEPITRDRIARIEEGDIKVQYSVVAAYLMEIGVFKDIIRLLGKNTGCETSMRHLLLLKDSLSPQIQKAIKEGDVNLRHQVAQEKVRGR